jgi:hypothetical protein
MKLADTMHARKVIRTVIFLRIKTLRVIVASKK